MESWRTTLVAVIPLLAGLALTIFGAIKGDGTMIGTGVGLLGAAGVGMYARDQTASKAAHEAERPK